VLLQDYVPEENFPEYSPGHREAFGESLQQLRRLVSSAELSVAHVNSGMDILTGLNARRVRKIPVYITADDFQETDDRFTLAMYPEGTRRILFAGEVDSASGVNDLYKTYWYFRRFVKEEKQDWQMLIAGDHRRCDSYNYTLKESIRRFELEQFWIVHNPGLEPDQLSALFARAEVFMTFDSGDLRGENIVRAIRQGLPVIAHSAAAGEDILGDSELLIHPLIHSAAAERLERLQRDEDWRRVVTEAQSERLENLEERAVSFLWTSALSRFA
jgi:glycosyltransferase involved in cell wall biosynthesis